MFEGVPDLRAEGVNVIGHLSSSAGLGNTTRLFIDLLHRRGYQVAGVDVEAYARQERPQLSPEMVFSDIRKLPFRHNFVIASIDRLPQLWLRHAKQLLEPRFRNAGLLFWELPVIPPAWVPSLEMFDVVLTCSQYVRQTFESAIPDVPTILVEHPINARVPEGDRLALRDQHGIPRESVVFCCSFDPRSGLARKNPTGAITAWLQAFPDRSDVSLVVKSNGPPAASDDPEVVEVLRRAARDPRIIWISKMMPHDAVMDLFHCCDVFVSLHRSEGLGQVPMEAMSLGKLVIATGYSGNMTFMNEQNSLPVLYRLVEPRNDRAFLTRAFAGRSARWAEPDLDRAAELMRRAVDEPGLASRLGEQARADIANRQRTAWRADYLDDMLRLMDESTRVPLRRRLRRKVLLQELVNPTLFRKNAGALLSRSGFT
jgi:glycosyltransferase involved in cell wall biosynthesis